MRNSIFCIELHSLIKACGYPIGKLISILDYPVITEHISIFKRFNTVFLVYDRIIFTALTACLLSEFKVYIAHISRLEYLYNMICTAYRSKHSTRIMRNDVIACHLFELVRSAVFDLKICSCRIENIITVDDIIPVYRNCSVLFPELIILLCAVRRPAENIELLSNKCT